MGVNTKLYAERGRRKAAWRKRNQAKQVAQTRQMRELDERYAFLLKID